MSIYPRLTLWLVDRDGNERQTGLSFPSLASIPEAVTIANACEGIIQSLTNAYISRAVWTLNYTPVSETQAGPETNVYERLVILFTDGITYASFSFPAPGNLPYDTTGPLRGVRLQAGQDAATDAIDALQAALGETLLPNGTPFPTGRWVAGRTLNQ